jgi:hypothetical protein
MSFDAQRLYQLLPAIYRIRDAEQGSTLQALISVLAQQAEVMEEDLAQLYDNLFIETCAPWVVPYIGDLIGTGAVNRAGVVQISTRAEVANTLRYRRAKGTLVVFEQLARDVTGWAVHSAEYFQLLAATQHVNHVRPRKGALLDLRDDEALGRIKSPFDRIAHTLDVRHIQNGRGRYNIPNIGIFLWRLESFSLTATPAFQLDAHRFLFNPLGINTQLFNLPETEVGSGALSVPVNVPEPLGRRLLSANLDDYYGVDRSILLIVNGNPVVPGPGQQTSDLITACDLSDFGSGWAHVPKNKIAIDPELGRIVLPVSQNPATVSVTFHYGFSAEMGGGEYPRAASFDPLLSPVHQAKTPAKIQDGLNGLATGGVLEITDNATYSETLTLNAGANRFAIRARDSQRPLVKLSSAFAISGSANGEVTLNGLVIVGTIHVGGALNRLNLVHCTLLPSSAAPSLIVESSGTTVSVDHSIVGSIRTTATAVVKINSSIVDALAEQNVAFAAIDGNSAGGLLSIENSTVIGKVHTTALALVSNSILLARLATADTWSSPVQSERRQQGCVRFSFIPFESVTPRRYRCQPARAEDATRVRPELTSAQYGNAAYCQLGARCAPEILAGADDGAEMGVFHDLLQPQRIAHLRLRLGEYSRFSLETGIFYAT